MADQAKHLVHQVIFLQTLSIQSLTHWQDSNVSGLEVPESYKVLLGTYKLDTTEGFEEFMVRLGVSPFMLLSDGVTKPVTIIRQSSKILIQWVWVLVCFNIFLLG